MKNKEAGDLLAMDVRLILPIAELKFG